MVTSLFTEAVIEKIISERDRIRTQIMMLEDDMGEAGGLKNEHCIELMVSLLRKESALTAELARFFRRGV